MAGRAGMVYKSGTWKPAAGQMAAKNAELAREATEFRRKRPVRIIVPGGLSLGAFESTQEAERIIRSLASRGYGIGGIEIRPTTQKDALRHVKAVHQRLQDLRG